MQKIISFVQVNFQQGPRELNAYYLPYTAGVVLAYALKHNPEWKLGELVWRRDDIEETAQRLKHSDIIGFSTYVWNHQYNYALARRVKELNPACLIVTGGPEIAITDPDLFVKNPWMDAAVKMEGELVFANVLKTEDLTTIPGLIVNCNGKAVDTGESERIGDLDQLPSPYLTGLFDNLLSAHPDVTWNATLETNRGCPYQCTFCDWGSLTYNKVKKFDIERVFAELEWIGEHCGFVTITDANFGMFVERDNAIVSKLIEVQHRWNRLDSFSMTWAKNQKNEVVDIVRRLVNESPTASQGLTVSVQSMDEGVLDVIKRRNLDQHKIEEIFTLCDQHNIPVHTEIILGLPGDTEAGWKGNFWRLFRAGNHTGISILHAQLLENAEMNLGQRKFYKLDAVPIYDYMSGSYSNGEVEESMEVVVGTRDIPRNKMIDIMVWNSFIQTFHINGLTTYIARYFARQGIDYEEFYDKLWAWLHQDPWWQGQFAKTRKHYQEWIANGRVNINVGSIEVPGWNLHNQTTLVLHHENKIDQTYNLIAQFLLMHFNSERLKELVVFQRAAIVDYSRLSALPQRQKFNWDFWGYLIYGERELDREVWYDFDTAEDKSMSSKMFLENFYFGRKRNFGKAQINHVKHLFIYHMGGRGDFLASILIGDVLKSSTAGAWVNPIGTDFRTHHKIHELNGSVITACGPCELESFSNYKTVRIKFETLQDCEDALKLARFKLPDKNYVGSVQDHLKFEKCFSQLDNQFDKIIPFRDLFDIEKIKPLFFEYRLRTMTAEEEQRIIENIQLNLDLLNH